MDEIRIGVLGNVDSGKTTLISVLKYGELDNGRGSARSKVFKHPHEKETGRTSSISHTYLNMEKKYISFVDMAGHQKYLKTTMYGINGASLDYVMILVGANMGVLKMTREHLGIAISLKIPTIIVITKIDICPESIKQQTIDDIKKILHKPMVKKTPISINDMIDNNLNLDTYIPICEVSNTKGINIDLLRNYLKTLSPNNKWIALQNEKKMVMIDSNYLVQGIGIVISGVVTSGIISTGDKILMGPFNGVFRNVLIKSIHNNFNTAISSIAAGNSGCFNLKFLEKKVEFKRRHIKKGMVLLDNTYTDKSYYEFLAEVKVLHHPTTIRINYEPVIHCGSVSQTAKICEMDCDYIRTGDKANIKFRFKRYPEFLEKNTKLMFREGKTKGIGIIKELY